MPNQHVDLQLFHLFSLITWIKPTMEGSLWQDTCMDGAETQQLDSKHCGNSRPISSTNSKRSGARSEVGR